MKKLKILAFAILAAVFACSCEDNTDTYVDQLYTNSEKAAAFKTCLTSAMDSAVNHLCVYNGFYQYHNASYRINFSTLQNAVFDTLSHHGKSYLVDSLILRTNRMAESCGSAITSAFTTAIGAMSYQNYDALINGDSTAICEYFELYKYAYLMSTLQSPVSIRMGLYNVTSSWNAVMQAYNQYSNVPVNIDFQNYVIDKMLQGIFDEMELEEINIRTNSSHRVDADALLGK